MEMNLFGGEKRTTQLLDVLVEAVMIISKSKFGSEFILKGGLSLLSALKEENKDLTRYTIDADLHWLQEESWHPFVDSLEELLNKNARWGFVYKITKLRELKNGSSSVSLEALSDDGLSFKFKFDMNIGSCYPGLVEERTLLNSNYSMKMYSLEAMLADKLKVLSSQKIYRRCKDLYDIYVLSYLKEFVLSEVVCISKAKNYTDQMVGPHFLGEGSLDDIAHAYSKLQLLNKPDFDVVVRRVIDFTLPIFDNIRFTPDNIKWDYNKGEWFNVINK